MSEALYSVPLFIDGEQHHPEEKFDVVSPATGRIVHRCGSASAGDATSAVNSAASAFKSWRKTTPSQRRDIFLKAAEGMLKRKDELSQYMVDETACETAWAEFNVNLTVDFIKDIAGRIATIEGTIPTLGDSNTSGLVLKEPYGVVLAIAPWNAPYILGCRAVAFPIAAGNTVVFKGSELSPRVMLALATCFHDAGLPKGVLNFIAHAPANAAAITSQLVSNPIVKKINFTGSSAVGRIIGRLAGENLKPVLLELGGKAPAIVWEDADLDLAADQCALGAFLHAGQICMSTERILIHRNVREAFEKKFAASIEKFFPASRDAPVLINSKAVEKNQALLKDAISKGASVVAGNIDAEEVTKTRLRPIVIRGVKPEMDIYRTESFGPSVSLIEIETEEEALNIANDTEYGLTSAVFTEDLRRGLRFAREIESGAVHINNMTVHDETAMPHGGAKASGFGRFNSVGLDEWVRTKNVTFKN